MKTIFFLILLLTFFHTYSQSNHSSMAKAYFESYVGMKEGWADDKYDNKSHIFYLEGKAERSIEFYKLTYINIYNLKQYFLKDIIEKNALYRNKILMQQLDTNDTNVQISITDSLLLSHLNIKSNEMLVDLFFKEADSKNVLANRYDFCKVGILAYGKTTLRFYQISGFDYNDFLALYNNELYLYASVSKKRINKHSAIRQQLDAINVFNVDMDQYHKNYIKKRSTKEMYPIGFGAVSKH